MEPSRSNFQALTDEITTPQIEASTVDLQSIAGEISSSQVETSTGDIQKITEELASLIERTSEYRHDKDVNIVDITGNPGAQQNVGHFEQEQSEKPFENIDVVDSKILKSGNLQPNGALGEQILSSEGLGVSYSQQEPAVVLYGSVDITTQNATMYPSEYQVTNGGQDGILEASTKSCVQNVFESQISEEYLPQANVENLKEINKPEQEVVVESIKDTGVLPQNDKVEEKKMLDSVVSDAKEDLPEVQSLEIDNVGSNVQSVQDTGDEEENLEAMNVDISVVTKKDDEKLEERKENAQEEKELPKKEEETLEKDGSQKGDETDLNIAVKVAANVAEQEEQSKETMAKGIISQEKSVTSSLTADENVTLDLRRSQRRAASPRKLSPSKSPSRKVETKVHGTRQQRQKTEQQGTQKEKAGQHGTLRDKTGQQSTSKDKTGQLGTRRGKTEQQGALRDKAGQPATQRGKADRQGSQKDEKEPETTQGAKRKRQGRNTKPAKFPKQ